MCLHSEPFLPNFLIAFLTLCKNYIRVYLKTFRLFVLILSDTDDKFINAKAQKVLKKLNKVVGRN